MAAPCPEPPHTSEASLRLVSQESARRAVALQSELTPLGIDSIGYRVTQKPQNTMRELLQQHNSAPNEAQQVELLEELRKHAGAKRQ